MQATLKLEDFAVELVSKELNHLTAILHFYAEGLIFMKNLWKVFKKSKIAQIYCYEPQPE